ncbi:MAG: sigma-70 family RNA polymerase sigma factor [Planctomycetes bacterium]|nr:sigma-70 family RNA polymerase sigma factor [Planctomycetota bacterium]
MAALARPYASMSIEHRPAPNPPTDHELVARVKEGDETAFREIVERHRHRIFALCFRLLRDTEAAEDAAQETFVKAFRRIDSFRGDSQLYTWLYRIAANVAHDAMQSRRRHRMVEADDLTTLEPPRHDDPRRPDREMEREDMRRIARAAISKLPPLFRTVLVLREYEGLEYREIAEALDISVGTVMSRLFRARMRFKDAVERLVPAFKDPDGQ